MSSYLGGRFDNTKKVRVRKYLEGTFVPTKVLPEVLSKLRKYFRTFVLLCVLYCLKVQYVVHVASPLLIVQIGTFVLS